MFEDFFENNAPVGEEKPNPARTEQIKAAVMKRISLDNAENNAESEEKKMKHIFMRPFVIAAAVAAVGAGSLVSANAANNGIVADTITIISSNADQPEAWKEVDENGSVLYYTLPADKSDSPDPEAETITSDDWSAVYYTVTDDDADSPDLEAETITSDDWSEVYYTLPDDKSDSPDLKAETITSNDWSVVYYTVSDDDADILYDYIFTLEQNGTSK